MIEAPIMAWPNAWGPYDWLAVISLAGPVVPLALVRQTQLVGLREIRL
jgi:hypothetical protein